LRFRLPVQFGGVDSFVFVIAFFVMFGGLWRIDAARAAAGCAAVLPAKGAFGKVGVGASAVPGFAAPFSASPAAATGLALLCVSTLPVVVFAAL